MVETLSRLKETRSTEELRSRWGYAPYPLLILIIGDNSSSTLQLRQRLENKGCRVCRADIDFNCLVTIRETYFDSVVLNLEQPDEDGLEICKKLEADVKLPQIPLIVLTGYRKAAEAVNGLKMSKIYCLPRLGLGLGTGARLLQIIENFSYITYRYG